MAGAAMAPLEGGLQNRIVITDTIRIEILNLKSVFIALFLPVFV
jgi:hypothetical protein